MELIFLKVLIVFTVSSFEFHKSDCLDFIAPIHPTSIH